MSQKVYVVSEKNLDEKMKKTLNTVFDNFVNDGYFTSKENIRISYDKNIQKDNYSVGDIIFVLSEEINAEEEFELHISVEKVVTIKANPCGCRGVLYGANMFLKYVREYGRNNLPEMAIKSYPATKERTVMLDCARKYFTPEWIKNFIRMISWMGYNSLELHFTEEQGIRMNIWDSDFFKSANGNDFSWICGSKSARWVENCPDPDAGKFLNAAEIVEILKTAEKYCIEIIPAFDMPGHSNYLTYTYRKYVSTLGADDEIFRYHGNVYTLSGCYENGTARFINNGGKEYTDWNDILHWKFNSCVDVTNPVARSFLLALIEDYADFFKKYGCKKFNICGDEVVLEYEGVTCAVGWTRDTFTEFMNEVAGILKAKGYKVRAFNDFLCKSAENGGGTAELDKDIEICYWDKTEGGREVEYFINQGRTIYNCISSYCYYVLRLNPSDSWQVGMDARSEDNKYFGFCPRQSAKSIWHGKERDISAGWAPHRVHTHKESEPIVTGEQLGGAYYLIWCDYAGLSTEDEIINGIDASGKYNLPERMWANIFKMWDWECEKKMSFEEFKEKTLKYGLYPGW